VSLSHSSLLSNAGGNAGREGGGREGGTGGTGGTKEKGGFPHQFIMILILPHFPSPSLSSAFWFFPSLLPFPSQDAFPPHRVLTAWRLATLPKLEVRTLPSLPPSLPPSLISPIFLLPSHPPPLLSFFLSSQELVEGVGMKDKRKALAPTRSHPPSLPPSLPPSPPPSGTHQRGRAKGQAQSVGTHPRVGFCLACLCRRSS